MKNTFLKRTLSLSWAILLAMLVVVSCSDSDEPEKPDDNTCDTCETAAPRGVYLTGSVIQATEVAASAKLPGLVVEGEGYAATARDFSYERYFYADGAGELTLMESKDEVETVYGGLVLTADTNVVAGALTVDGKISVPSAGFYYLAVDLKEAAGLLTKVESIGVIGSAIGSWSNDIDFTLKTPGKDVTVWEIVDVPMFKEQEYKFRFNNTWTSQAVFGADTVNIFTNIGAPLEGETSLSTGGGNIKLATETGLYKITITYDYVANTFTEAITRTGDYTPPSFVPQDHTFSLIGNAMNNAEGVKADWDYDLVIPYLSSAGDLHTYKITGASLIGGGEFKIRQDLDWGVNWGFADMTGDMGNISDSGGNAKVTADKSYTVTFVYNGADDTVSITLTEE
jgi:hypothetical protein